MTETPDYTLETVYEPAPKGKTKTVYRKVPVPVSTGGGSYKALILAEMMVLFAGGLITAHNNGEEWKDIVIGRMWKQGLAAAILLGFLLVLADLGAGGAAAMFGGLIVLGYLAVAGNYLGDRLVEMEKGLFE